MTPHTWYMATDPVANGNRCWFMLWLAALETGDLYIHREWPQRNKFIEGVGFPGPWAETGSIRKLPGGGTRGPGQMTWADGFSGFAREIVATEQDIAKDLATLQGKDPINTKPIPIYRRIMDSRSGNTTNLSNSEGATLIEIMDNPMFKINPGFESAGKDSVTGANRYTSVGEQIIADALSYNADKCRLNPLTNKLDFDGRRPTLFINPECENLIDALSNYPGATAGDSAWDDPIDCLRYLLIAEPQHYAPRLQPIDEIGGW